MNIAGGKIMAELNRRDMPHGVTTRHFGRAPAVRCPACNAKANTRSSEEISPTYRRMYFACTDIRCGHTWLASLSFEHTLSPSGVSAEFRPATMKPSKPPGHDFGQMSMFDILPPTLAD